MITPEQQTFPIEAIKTEFLTQLTQQQTILLTAPPGAGKSTVLPLWLLEQPSFKQQKIYLLQPRRLAAKNIACYLAKQLGEAVGQRVGYRLRNDTKVSAMTQLEVITEGVLIRLLQADPELADCSLILFDEFHERSVNADLAFALARDVQQGLREDLKLVLMSATLASDEISQQLPDAISISSVGRSYPVDISYQAPASAQDWRQHALQVIKHTLQTCQATILVFLPRSGDIRYLSEHIAPFLDSDTLLCPLYGDLTLAEQQQAIALPAKGQRKLVLSTNIAETSLTIEGVSVVIDAGLENNALYDNKLLANKLLLRTISKASAVQRAGRAGRLMAGRCIRLYAEQDFQRRPEQSSSEILQTDLLPVLMEAARWGVTECQQLPMLELPKTLQEQISWQELQQLGLVNEQRQLTAIGQQVAQFPVHPRFAKMLVAARTLTSEIPALLSLAALLCALLEERDIFTKEQRQHDADINHRVRQLFQQPKLAKHQRILAQAKRLFTIAQQQSSTSDKPSSTFTKQQAQLPLAYTGLLLASAYPERIAKQRGKHGNYLSAYGKGVELDELDALAESEFIVAVQLFQYQQKLKVALASSFSLSDAIQFNLVKLSHSSLVSYDQQQQAVRGLEQQKLGAIIIKETVATAALTQEQTVACWLQQIRQQGLVWLAFSEEVQQLLLRWRWLNLHQSQLGFPDVSEVALLADLEQWLAPYLVNVQSRRQLQQLDFNQILLAQLDYQQQQLFQQVAPSYFVGPTGRKCPIRYEQALSPTVSVPMQELYGLTATPAIGDGQNNPINLTLEILSPAQRPIQITQHLAEFWQGSYAQVQKDMKARYPKHYWPDDPANAQATQKTKRFINNQ